MLATCSIIFFISVTFQDFFLGHTIFLSTFYIIKDVAQRHTLVGNYVKWSHKIFNKCKLVQKASVGGCRYLTWWHSVWSIWWKKKAIVYLMMFCTICNHHTRVIKSLSAIFKIPPVGGISSYVVAFILFSIKKAWGVVTCLV